MRRTWILTTALAVGSAVFAATTTWIKTQPDPAPSFSRSSVAYLDGSEYAANYRRLATVAIPSASDGEIRAAEGVSSRHIKPTCKIGNRMYGVDATISRIYTSTDGASWATTGMSTLAATSHLFNLPDGTLLAFRSPHNGSSSYLWYDIYNTSTGAITSSTEEGHTGALQLNKTGAFTARSTADLIYVLFEATYTPGWYKIIKVSNNAAILTTLADVDVAYVSDKDWWAGVGSAITDSSGKPLVTRTNCANSQITGQAGYFVFANHPEKDGYYKIVRVSDNTLTLQTSANPGVDCVYADFGADYCVFNLGTNVHYSTDGGANFTVAHFLPTIKFTTYPASGSTVRPWDLHAHGSTVIVGEYGAAGAVCGKYLHRSVDGGATWTRVASLDVDDVETDIRIAGLTVDGYHWHTVGYHAATDRWIAGFGDSSACAGLAVSSDNGATWSLLAGNGLDNMSHQPIGFWDTGDPTRILAANDGSVGLCWVDMATGRAEPIPVITDPRSSRYFFFGIYKYGGVYYGMGYDNSGSSPAPVLLVSTNLVNWSVYHKFTVADTAMGFENGICAGEAGGKLHFPIWVGSSSYRHFAISPATVRNVNGVMIEPGITNLLTTANKSSFETDVTELTSATLTVSKATESGSVGSYCAKAVLNNTTAGVHYLQTGQFSLTSGAKYVLQFRAKSTYPVKVNLFLYKAGSAMDTAYHSYFSIGTQWRECISCPITADASVSTYTVALQVDKGADPVELWVDALQVNAAPVASWQVGGTAKTADVLTEVVDAPYEWTDIFAVQTLGTHLHYTTSTTKFYIKTWKVGSDEIQLYFDSSDPNFYLQRNAETPVSSAAQEWNPNQVIKFALRADSAGLTLDIQNGRASEQITDSALAAVLNAEVTMIYGDVSSANQFPGIYFDAPMEGAKEAGFGFIPWKLTNADVAAAFNLSPTVTASD